MRECRRSDHGSVGRSPDRPPQPVGAPGECERDARPTYTVTGADWRDGGAARRPDDGDVGPAGAGNTSVIVLAHTNFTSRPPDGTNA
jgi:hypothetical protein